MDKYRKRKERDVRRKKTTSIRWRQPTNSERITSRLFFPLPLPFPPTHPPSINNSNNNNIQTRNHDSAHFSTILCTDRIVRIVRIVRIARIGTCWIFESETGGLLTLIGPGGHWSVLNNRVLATLPALQAFPALPVLGMEIKWTALKWPSWRCIKCRLQRDNIATTMRQHCNNIVERSVKMAPKNADEWNPDQWFQRGGGGGGRR